MTFEAQLAAILKTTEKNAMSRAMGLRILPVCGRCGGCGHYSYNQISGTVCFGCNGSGQVIPKTAAQKKQTLEEAQCAVDQGKLEPYLARLAANARIKKGSKALMKAWQDTGINNLYDWRKSYGGTPREDDGWVNPNFCQRDCDIAAINKKMSDAYTKFQEKSDKLPKPTADDYQEKVMELDSILAECFMAIISAAEELEAYCEK